MKTGTVLLVSLLILLSACGKSIRVPTQPVLATEPSIVEPNFTSTVAFTPSPVPSSTPAPTNTLEPFFATQQALHLRLDKYCARGNSNRIDLSPDGQWAGLECDGGMIKVVRTDEKKEWELPYESLFGPYSSAALFIGMPHWSVDGLYVYVSANPHTDGYWEPFHSASVLYRFNLETGQVSEVLPAGKDSTIYYSFAFAPDDSMLAYIETDTSPVVLVLRNLETGAEKKIEFDPKYNTGGGFLWTPDGQKLVFSVTQFDRNTFEYVATLILLWDRTTGEPVHLISDYQDFLEPIAWAEENKVILHGWTVENEQLVGLEHKFDMTTGELIQIVP